MTRTTQRVQFPGHAENLLAGILELPSREPKGFILFSHCFTCGKDLKAIVRISRSLADLGWGVLRYDFTGLGNSQGEFSTSNFTYNREDLRAAAFFLGQRYAQPSFLMGHSFGGAVSLSMATELPSVRGVIAIASPSDTHHLASLLEHMNPEIASRGEGFVTIGGRDHFVKQQMLDDFRAYDLRSIVDLISKPILAFHSPTDETVDFRNALINCGLESRTKAPFSGQRSLISLPDCNHLLTTNGEDCVLIAEIADAWCRRFMG